MRIAVVAAVVAVSVAAFGVPPAAAEEDDDPIGYTLGVEFKGISPICDFFSVELDSGELHRINAAPVFCGDGLTFDDDGRLYAYRNPNVRSGIPPMVSQLIKIDLDDGKQHVIGNLPGVQTGDGGMTFDEDGNLWLYGRAPIDPECPAFSACLWKVDPEDASTTFVGATPEGVGVFGLTGDCDDVLAITTEPLAGPVPSGSVLDEVHTKTAALEHIVDVPGVLVPQGLDFDGDGRLWALSLGSVDSVQGPFVNRIDPDDGSSTRRQVTLNGGTYDGALFGLAVDPIECDDPEPPAPPAPAPTAVVVEPVFTG